MKCVRDRGTLKDGDWPLNFLADGSVIQVIVDLFLLSFVC
jgi:hypothetical protein